MAKKFLYSAALFSLLFLIVFFLSAVIFSQVLLKSEIVTVPDLTGKAVAQARAELQKKDLTLAQKGTESNDRIEKGLIVRQDPAAGSKIRVTRVVQVFTSSGSGTVSVPDLAGKTLDEALTLLQAAGSDQGQADPGPYAARSRPAGSSTRGRSRARSSSAASPSGSSSARATSTTCTSCPTSSAGAPTASSAASTAWGFKVADIRYVYYPGAPAGLIVKQAPPNGYRIQKRNRISLEVSR